jgi:hypothetical protein
VDPTCARWRESDLTALDQRSHVTGEPRRDIDLEDEDQSAREAPFGLTFQSALRDRLSLWQSGFKN